MTTVATFGSGTTTTTITAGTPTRPKRLSGPAKDAREDYHDFIGTVEKSTKQTVFSEQQRKRRRAQRLPVGTTRLFDHGRMRLIPFPSANPKDPLNLPEWRKWAAILVMSMFGALAVATETASGNLLEPIFALQYAGVNPVAIRNATFTLSTTSASLNLTTILGPLLPPDTTPFSTSQINMLTTVPMLTTAAASYVQIPLSVAVGRRPVLLLASACAWIGALWAGLSSSGSQAATAATMSSAFQQHVAARALVGLGAGTVNALVPLVAAHDLVFLHQRHLVLAVSFAIQALVTASLSAAAPFLAAFYDWRWMYYIVGTAGFLAWLALVALVPETRWTLRTKTQLCGGGCGGDGDLSVYADEDNDRRKRNARLDYEAHGGRTLWTDTGVFVVSPFAAWQWSRAGSSVVDLVRTALLPAVVWVAVVQAVLLVASTAAAELAATMLLVAAAATTTKADSFSLTGLVPGVALGVAGVLTLVLGAVGARFTLAVTRHLRAQQNRRLSVLTPAERRAHKKARPTVRREAEHNLPVVVLPLALAIAGSFVVGAVLNYASTSTVLLLLGPTLLALAMVLALVGGSVFLMESYPVWAGPCLAHANSWRFVAAFFLQGTTASFVAREGALEVWAVYAEILIVASLGLPALFFGGRWLRTWAAGTVSGSSEDTSAVGDGGRRATTIVSPSPSESSMMTGSTVSSTTATTASVRPDTVHSSEFLGPHPGTAVDVGRTRHQSLRDEGTITGRAL
ncbi:hypothetical protein HMPREF1624_03921 [Sporothrix schenckii ATCC 58251]|uniref:Major facilitator superfamily (MFS) profile domain-containing protein n=1 Tax=Sporothrix schenckii (strain ATCC 58251 / de Perez 2211183) TaxID=1391915 RepID=U7Q056_SPOS1|nr:hypothetical protein HMPREF1624_03921 [Sporothrix schenckii ATCC 58251]